MNDQLPEKPTQEILEYPYWPHAYYMLATMTVIYWAVAIAHAWAAAAHVCIMRDPENCTFWEKIISLEFAVLSFPLAVAGIAAFLRRKTLCLRLSPEGVQVVTVLVSRSFAYRDVTRAWLVKTVRGSYVQLSFGTISLGSFRVPKAWLKIWRKWLPDDAAFETVCREIESRLGRKLEVVDKAAGKELVTGKALVIAIGLPAAIVGLMYIDVTKAMIAFVVVAAAIIGYAAWVLGDVIYRLKERK